MSLVLINGLETAKASLENEGSSENTLRIAQGESKAYRGAFNVILKLAEEEKETEDER